MARTKMNRDQSCLLVAMIFVVLGGLSIASDWHEAMLFCSFTVGVCCGISLRNLL